MSTNALALSQLLLAERPSLLRLARRIVGNLAAAEDVTQSLWFRVQGVADEPAIANKRAYLYRLTANLATDRLRADRRYEALFPCGDGDLPQGVAAPAASPEAIVIGRAQISCLNAALAELAPRTREIFLLRKMDELSIDAICQRLGVGRSAVMKHLRQALLHCDARLREQE